MSPNQGAVGSTPLSITGSKGQQRVVPLSALQFNGSALEVRSAWTDAGYLTPDEVTALKALAEARKTLGELTKPPVRPPVQALVVIATKAGPESNHIVVRTTVAADSSTSPAPAKNIEISAAQADTYDKLTSAATAGEAIGTAAVPPGSALVYLADVSDSSALPKNLAATVVPADGLAVADADGATLFTVHPRSGFTAAQGLTVAVTTDTATTTFSVVVAYDSVAETTTPVKVTIQDLAALAPPVAQLVTLIAPPAGAAVPADTTDEGVGLSGGAEGIPARAVLYTPGA